MLQILDFKFTKLANTVVWIPPAALLGGATCSLRMAGMRDLQVDCSPQQDTTAHTQD